MVLDCFNSKLAMLIFIINANQDVLEFTKNLEKHISLSVPLVSNLIFVFLLLFTCLLYVNISYCCCVINFISFYSIDALFSAFYGKKNEKLKENITSLSYIAKTLYKWNFFLWRNLKFPIL